MNKVLHPEILLGRRGDKSLISYLKTAMSGVTIDESGERILTDINGFDYLIWSPIAHFNDINKIRNKLLKFPREISKNSDNLHMILQKMPEARYLMETLGVLKRHQANLSHCYYVSPAFFSELKNFKGKIPLDILDPKFSAYIAIPDETPFPGDLENSYWEGFYVRFNLANVLQIVVVIKDKKTKELRLCYIAIDKQTMLDFITKEDEEFTVAPMIRLIANILVFIHSPGSLQIPLSPFISLTKEDKLKAKQAKIPVNGSSLDLILINWAYQTLASTKSETERVAHWRWQRVGPELKAVRAVLIKATTVRF